MKTIVLLGVGNKQNHLEIPGVVVPIFAIIVSKSSLATKKIEKIRAQQSHEVRMKVLTNNFKWFHCVKKTLNILLLTTYCCIHLKK